MPKPSSPEHAFRHTPRPQNWRGVETGMAEGTRLLQESEFSRAEAVLRQVLEFAPMEGRAWHLLGRILQKTDRHAEALTCFDRAETCYNHHQHDQKPPASIRLARLLWDQGACEEARAMLGILMMRDSDDDQLRQLRETWSQRDEQSA